MNDRRKRRIRALCANENWNTIEADVWLRTGIRPGSRCPLSDADCARLEGILAALPPIEPFHSDQYIFQPAADHFTVGLTYTFDRETGALRPLTPSEIAERERRKTEGPWVTVTKIDRKAGTVTFDT